MKQRKVLILGVAGMVGHKLFIELSKRPELDVYATTRNIGNLSAIFGPELVKRVRVGIDAHRFETVAHYLEKLRPNVVINCIGITKQLVDDHHPIPAIEINALMPHRLAEACKLQGIRMIQMATDCVFNGSKGNYRESDPSDATDLYGRTKFLGEVYYGHCLTIRTSFIGHEIGTSHGLVEWFLHQDQQASGYTKAIYSGLPTVEIARVMAELIIPNQDLHGLYHVSSDPISKYDLLQLLAHQYAKKIAITPNDTVAINRSLNSDRFRAVTGFRPRSWAESVEIMYEDCTGSRFYAKL